MTEQKPSKRSPARTRPKAIVTLCGSTRFMDEFERINSELTRKGYVVFSVATEAHRGTSVSKRLKTRLDQVHKRKIDLSDEVFIINPGGYIGESTKSEIAYALKHGKKVIYLVAK